MTHEAQRIAIAEAHDGKPVGFYAKVNPKQFHNYLSDLNAMHEAEKVLTDEQMREYDGGLLTITSRDYDKHRSTARFCDNCTTHATAAQRAEAFLRCLNLWDDSK